jgi:2-polyprenyl-6-methoxyphenol hydroxylase-like FAD-dependent oxidoreductase
MPRMGFLRVAVLGAGVSGLAAALALARARHQVTLIERDGLEVGAALDSVDWSRRGIPHFLQAHSFTCRGYRELREAFPDVLQALLDAGADDIDLVRKMPGVGPSTHEPGDEDLRLLGVRRPLIEWALRRAVVAEPNLLVVANTTVVGLDATAGEVPQVSGVRTSGGSVGADLVIDAMGRRSPVPGWIAAFGGTPMAEESSDCGVIYYTRYYRVREGRSLPDGPWLPTPRADLGYGLFSSFPGDNGTFAGLVAIPPGDQDLKLLRHEAAFDAATALMPALWSWVSPDISTPITGVLPMGSLQNTLRTPVHDRPPAIGLISIGDALCHTDPVFALGMSFAFLEARELRAALSAHGSDLEAAARAFDAAVRPSMVERFGFAAALDDLRVRRWTGESFDVAHRDGGAYPLFIMAAGAAAALVDAEVFRATVRRNYFLDPLSIVDEDVKLQARIERIFGELMATPRPAAGPTRSDLLEAMQTATA